MSLLVKKILPYLICNSIDSMHDFHQKFLKLTFFFLVALAGCKTAYQPLSVLYNDYKIVDSIREDPALEKMLKPYSDSVNKKMNDVIAVTSVELVKKQPEGTLGNILADAMLAMAKQKYSLKVDAAFINFGGIRLPFIPVGEITRGKIYELAPFDNVIVLQKISGKVLKEFLDHVANFGGWPGAGITWQIKEKKAVNILIGSSPLDENAFYLIANNDYVANGGDNCTMLRDIPQLNKGYLFRDAVIEYFSQFTKEGKKIFAKPENRVSNAN